jgi:hypothetical protein
VDRKQSIADESVKGVYRFLASPYAVRAGNVLWRIMSDFQRTRSARSVPVELMQARIEQLEGRLDVLQAKIEGLSEMVARQEVKAKPAAKKRKPRRAKKEAGK